MQFPTGQTYGKFFYAFLTQPPMISKKTASPTDRNPVIMLDQKAIAATKAIIMLNICIIRPDKRHCLKVKIPKSMLISMNVKVKTRSVISFLSLIFSQYFDKC